MSNKYETDLRKYTSGGSDYTPLMNIWMGGYSGSRPDTDYYVEIGKYIVDTFGVDDLPDQLGYFQDKIKEVSGRHFIKRVGSRNELERIYSSCGIHFIAGVLDEKLLFSIFGEPLYHNEFGEGFEGEYDEESDEYLEPTNISSYASYFVDLGGVKTHIGFDHRGTRIEVEVGTSPEELFGAMKILVDRAHKVL